jgi:protein lifeguard
MNNNWNQNMYTNNNSNMTGNMYYQNNNYAEWKQVDYADSQDIEKGGVNGIDYAEAYIRTGFIKKVYGILSFQMVLTTIMCVIAMIIPEYTKFQLANSWLMWSCFIAGLVCIISLTCFRDLSRKVPINYLLLILFTLCEGYLVSFVCNLTEPRIVIMAASMTCFITLALTLYSCTTKKDFTIYGSIVFLLACVLLLFSIFFLFTQNKLIHIIVSCFGVLIYSFYLIYDTQLLIGNKQNAMDTEDYILCSIMLYLDIVNIFLYILDILKSSSE